MPTIYKVTDLLNDGDVNCFKADSEKDLKDFLIKASFKIERCSHDEVVAMIGDTQEIIVIAPRDKKAQAKDTKTIPLPFPEEKSAA